MSASLWPNSRRIATVCWPSAGTASMRGGGDEGIPGGTGSRHLSRGRVDIDPTPARGQLWVRPYFPHVVHARIGDLRSVEPLDHLRGG